MTDKQDATPPANPAGGERIVIRDKRKVGVTEPGSAAPTPPAEPAQAGPGPSAESAATQGAAADGAVSADADEPVEAGPTGTATAGSSTSDGELEAGPSIHAAELGQLRSTMDERTVDLQRVTAEYANYRKRVERDRTLAAEQAVGMVLATLLPVLDDIDRARDHGDLNGPFASVAEQLTTAVTKLGLTPFGAKGDPFDPNRHEAVAHLTSAEVTESTCIDVMRRGYLLGERLLRPAMVAVADPE